MALRPGQVSRASVRVEPVGLPEKIIAPSPDADLAEWLRDNKPEVGGRLADVGALLFRGFLPVTAEELEALAGDMAGGLAMEYVYGSTPRSQIRGRVFTATDYPADRVIPLHNEMSYARSWPRVLAFTCRRAAASGGCTPLADSREIYRQLSPGLCAEFERRGVMYLRNFGQGVDLSWAEAFRTTDREQVERICAGAGIELEWRGPDDLTTRQVCQAVLPVHGGKAWFNQAHLFHWSALDDLVRRDLEEALPLLPRNAYFGDGGEIAPALLEEIRAIYDRCSQRFRWQVGDVLLINNESVAHGRDPFRGGREIWVTMAGNRGVEA